MRFKQIKNYAKDFIFKDLLPYLKSRNRKPLGVQWHEIRQLQRCYGVFPNHYFRLGLYDRRKTQDVCDYFPGRLGARRRGRFQSQTPAELVADKLAFHEFALTTGLPVPDTLFWSQSGTIYGPDGELPPTQALEQLRHHPAEIIAKPRFGAGGNGVMLLEKTSEALSALAGSTDAYIYQERLLTHPDLARFHAGAVNSVRIDTTYIDGRWPHSGAIFRVGTGGQITDGVSSGGMLIAVDLDSGALAPYGAYRPAVSQDRFDRLPDTGAVFAGCILPDFAQLKTIVVQGAAALSGLRTIGWDVALTDRGPVVIEANAGWNLNSMQFAVGGLRHAPIGRLLFDT